MPFLILSHIQGVRAIADCLSKSKAEVTLDYARNLLHQLGTVRVRMAIDIQGLTVSLINIGQSEILEPGVQNSAILVDRDQSFSICSATSGTSTSPIACKRRVRAHISIELNLVLIAVH
jgi:hypothetical protein